MAPNRQLRSRDTRKYDSLLLYFDALNPLVAQDLAIPVSPEFSSENLVDLQVPLVPPQTVSTIEYHPTKHANFAPKNATSGARNTTILPRKTLVRQDPLDDSIYAQFHRIQAKREASAVNLERSMTISDMDTLKNQRSQLTRQDWEKYLPGITWVNDIHDNKELVYKRSLTISEINRRLAKYNIWKVKMEAQKRDMKLHHHLIKKDDDIETKRSEYDIPIAELRQRRLNERINRIGGVRKLILRNGFYIHIDPIKPPKIVKDVSETPSFSKLSTPVKLSKLTSGKKLSKSLLPVTKITTRTNTPNKRGRPKKQEKKAKKVTKSQTKKDKKHKKS